MIFWDCIIPMTVSTLATDSSSWTDFNHITINTFPKSGGNSSALAAAAANCDPDYGWIDGPEGTNKCYMYLKVGPV